MFKWLFKFFGYVPIEELEETKALISEMNKGVVVEKNKARKKLDARTLFELAAAGTRANGLSVGHHSYRDDDGDFLPDTKYLDFSVLGEDEHELCILNADLPAYPDGPEGEVWLIYLEGHSVNSIDIDTCCWNRTVYQG